MGWLNEDYPDHEGYVVTLVAAEGCSTTAGVYRELGYASADRAERRDVAVIQAACSCGWRSPYLTPGRGWQDSESGGWPLPSYSPYASWVTEGDEDRCRKLWRCHMREPLPERGRGGGAVPPTRVDEEISTMTRDEYLTELQRRIAKEKGYTGLHTPLAANNMLVGVLHPDEGPTLVPRWPQEWADAGVLVEEMRADPALYGITINFDPLHGSGGLPHEMLFYGVVPNQDREGHGHSFEEAESRCWCAWKGVDLSDLPSVA